MVNKNRMRIEVVYALADRYWSVVVHVAASATVADVLALARIEDQISGLVIDSKHLAIYSRPTTLNASLCDGDRIEILRPLLVDPKQSRRERARASAPKKR